MTLTTNEYRLYNKFLIAMFLLLVFIGDKNYHYSWAPIWATLTSVIILFISWHYIFKSPKINFKKYLVVLISITTVYGVLTQATMAINHLIDQHYLYSIKKCFNVIFYIAVTFVVTKKNVAGLGIKRRAS